MGSNINVASMDRFSPAPLDIHTENVNLFRPARFELDICNHLENSQ